MKMTFLFLVILLANSFASAQWRKIADFGGEDEYITCVYFLDLPGPPRIGFVGTGTNLYKTTNGGVSWTKVWGKGYYALYYVTDVCFKDSLTGWFAVFGDTDACYRTKDGGETWKEICSSPYGALGVYYSQSDNLLFLSLADDTGMRSSSDLGDTWRAETDTETGGITFLTGSIGIASAYPPFPDTASTPDTNYGFFRTTDGGVTWSFLPGPFSRSPLSIAGQPICFAANEDRTTIWRSNDYGMTWRKIADFGPLVDSSGKTHPYCTGYIKGDLSRLSIQTDSGMYISTDSGVTWRNDGGPTYLTNFSNDDFYSAKGVTIAGMTYGAYGGAVDAGGGLWEEDWPQSGVAEQEPYSNALRVFPNPAGSSITVEPATGPLSIFDPLGRGYSVPTQGATLDVSALPSGVYFINDGVRRTKFIKD